MTDDFYCDEALTGRTPIERVLETEAVLAFHHTRPHWRHHVVVIPKRHIPSLVEIAPGDEDLLRELIDVVRQVAAQITDQAGGCHVVTNVGMYQDSKHLHFHVGAGETFPGAGR